MLQFFLLLLLPAELMDVCVTRAQVSKFFMSKQLYWQHFFFHWFCFVWFDSLRAINNLSVIRGRVFLGKTSTKLGLMFLLKDTTQWHQWGSNPRSLGLESSTLPLSHCAPSLYIESCSLITLFTNVAGTYVLFYMFSTQNYDISLSP